MSNLPSNGGPCKPPRKDPVTGAIDRSQRGIQSIEVGGQVLLALVHCGRLMPLKELAAVAGMPPAGR